MIALLLRAARAFLAPPSPPIPVLPAPSAPAPSRRDDPPVMAPIIPMAIQEAPKPLVPSCTHCKTAGTDLWITPLGKLCAFCMFMAGIEDDA